VILAILGPRYRTKVCNPVPNPIDDATPRMIQYKQKYATYSPCLKIAECGPSMKFGAIIAADSSTTKTICFSKNERQFLVKSLTTSKK